MHDVSINLISTQVERPFCPRCHLPMRFSHLEPAHVSGREHMVYACTCGEAIAKVMLRDTAT